MKMRFVRHLAASTAAVGFVFALWPVPVAGQDAPESAIEAWLANQPAEAFDVAALGAKLSTPEQAFNYVRDHIAYEPYSGAMKGAAGALLTHGANDVDRALLLASLLAAQNIEVRLAHGPLSDAAARGLLADALQHPDAVGRMLATLPAAPDPSPNESFEQKAQHESFRHGVADRQAETRLAVASQVALLKPLADGLAPAEFAAPHPHVWIQAVIDGRQVDLDPSRTDAKFGEAPASAEGTWAVDDLPDDERHTLTVSVVKETLAGGKLRRHALLTKEFRSTDLLAGGFRLVISPKDAPGTTEDFLPVLISPDDTTTGEVFRLSGEIPGPAPSTDAGGLLGGFGGGAPEPAPAAADASPPSTLARLWVEVAFHSPALPDETDRRMIVDRVEPHGDSWQLLPELAAAASVRPLLVQVWDAGLDVGAPHPLAWIQTELAALKTAEPLRAALTSGTEINPDDLPAQPLAPPLQGFFLASGMGRHGLAAASGFRVRGFLVRPRLAFLRHGFVVHDWSKPGAVPPAYAEGLDVVNEPVRGFGAAGAGSFALQAGLLDTVLEQYVLDHELRRNTVPLFAAAHQGNVPLVVVSAAEQLGRIDAPAALRVALEDDLAQGRVLLVPGRLVECGGVRSLGWWSLDPRTGALLGKMDLGAGQAMMEYSKVSETVAKLSQEFGKLMGNMIRCYGGAIGASLGSRAPASGKSAGGESTDAELLKCLRSAACEALKDFYNLAKSSFGGAEEESALAGIKETKDMIKELDEAINEMAKGSEGDGDGFSKGCQLALGGGGG